MRVRGIIIAWLVVWAAVAPAVSERQLAIVVVGEVVGDELSAGGPIPLKVTIKNQMQTVIRYGTFGARVSEDSIGPRDWNGETVSIALLDIYRDAEPGSLFVERPKVTVPRLIAGMGSHRISPGGTLVVHTDASQWRIKGGWIPGRYRASVRVGNIVVDAYAKASVLSDPFEFVLK